MKVTRAIENFWYDLFNNFIQALLSSNLKLQRFIYVACENNQNGYVCEC